MVLMLNFFGRAPDCGPLSVEGRALPPCLTFFLSARRWRASVSRGNSLVSKTLQVVVAKWRSFAPITVVTPSNTSRVWSVCIRSFANPCQLQHVNRSVTMVELCGSGRSPSKTGIEHYTCHSQIRYSSDKGLKAEPTCKRSSKSRAASFFNSETLVVNLRIVSLPKVGIFR